MEAAQHPWSDLTMDHPLTAEERAAYDPETGGARLLDAPAPQVQPARVGAGIVTNPAHQVKVAAMVRRGRASMYAVECVCGWSSPLYTSESLANAGYAAHKTAAAAGTP